MLIVETIARIRREHFVQGKSIKEIARDLRIVPSPPGASPAGGPPATGGAPKGNRNTMKHGGFTAETMADRRDEIWRWVAPLLVGYEVFLRREDDAVEGGSAQIVLKNSDFRFDHNSEDRWRPRWKIPWGFGGRAAFAACDPSIGLAVANTRA